MYVSCAYRTTHVLREHVAQTAIALLQMAFDSYLFGLTFRKTALHARVKGTFGRETISHFVLRDGEVVMLFFCPVIDA